MTEPRSRKRRYLPRIASGEWTTAFALTEPDAGSDAANIRTAAVLDGDHWVLNGNKVFITNADAAQLFTTIVLTDERASGGVTAFIVEKGHARILGGGCGSENGVERLAYPRIGF